MKMNYRVNEKTQTVSIYGELTESEQAIISLYIKQGYTLKPAKRTPRAGEKDILKWFDNQADEKGKAKFLADKKKDGYLKAVAQFRKEYPKAMEEIKKNLK